jgi:hypothetical protein
VRDYQIERVLGIVRLRRQGPKIRLSQDALAQPEPLRLVDPQNRKDLVEVLSTGFPHEIVDLGPLALLPQVLGATCCAGQVFPAARSRRRWVPLGGFRHRSHCAASRRG